MRKIIEFSGMPAAGKSTQIELLVKELERLGKTFTLFSEREMSFSEAGRSFYEFNRRNYLKLLEIYQEWRSNASDFLILDRGFYDRLVWPTADFEAGYCSEEEKESLIQLAQENERPFVDHIFLMMVPPEVSLKRRVKPKTEIDTFIVTKSYLSILYQAYQRLQEEHLPEHAFVIDGMKSIEEKQRELNHHLFLNFR